MHRVGIVILNYGTPEETCNLVLKIKDYKKLDKIVIVDNPAGNDSATIIEDCIDKINDSKISLIKSEENGGYAKGNNIGLKQLIEMYECDICFIANPDISFDESSFNIMLDCFAQHDEIGILTCKRVMSDGSRIRQFWGLPCYNDIIQDTFFIFRKARKKKEIFSIKTKSDLIDIPVAPGAFFAVRSDLLRNINYLDEETFLFYEENCLARRIEKTQFKIMLATKAEYCILVGKASTDSMKKNGRMMKYLRASQRHYLTEYLNIKGLKLWIYDFLCCYNYFELKIGGLLRKFRTRKK